MQIVEIRRLALFVLAVFARLMMLGRSAAGGDPRHIWWNFVSSSKERIEQAKRIGNRAGSRQPPKRRSSS